MDADQATGLACELCGHPDGPVAVTVADSGYLHPTDAMRDGRRVTGACSAAHAYALIDRGRRRWVDEQLWLAKIDRLSAGWNRTRIDLDEIAELAGLTQGQLRSALRWRFRTRAPRSDSR